MHHSCFNYVVTPPAAPTACLTVKNSLISSSSTQSCVSPSRVLGFVLITWGHMGMERDPPPDHIQGR